MGAWIETINHNGLYALEWSPLAWGRGLKLIYSFALSCVMVSPLAWGRGLKPCTPFNFVLFSYVAPRVGAWIETDNLNLSDDQLTSPLAWGRGLKLLMMFVS